MNLTNLFVNKAGTAQRQNSYKNRGLPALVLVVVQLLVFWDGHCSRKYTFALTQLKVNATQKVIEMYRLWQKIVGAKQCCPAGAVIVSGNNDHFYGFVFAGLF